MGYTDSGTVVATTLTAVKESVQCGVALSEVLMWNSMLPLDLRWVGKDRSE